MLRLCIWLGSPVSNGVQDIDWRRVRLKQRSREIGRRRLTIRLEGTSILVRSAAYRVDMKTQLIIAPLLTAAMAGCHGAPTSPSGIAAAPATKQGPTTTPVSVGTWVGVTDQSKRVDFVVAGDRITNVNFSVLFPSDSCGGSLSAGAGGPLLGSIVDGRLLVNWASVSGLQWLFEGTLSTASTAVGTLRVNYSRPATVPQVPPCAASLSVSWTAGRAS